MKLITFYGKEIDFLNLSEDMFCIEDIAHGLSMENRWGGHKKIPISVAMHCNWMYNMAPKKDKLEALMHDASEAYLKDIPKPLKNLLPCYMEIEDNMMKIISAKFGFPYPKTKAVHDLDMLSAEWETLFSEKAYETFHENPTNSIRHQKDLFIKNFNACCEGKYDLTESYYRL